MRTLRPVVLLLIAAALTGCGKDEKIVNVVVPGEQALALIPIAHSGSRPGVHTAIQVTVSISPTFGFGDPVHEMYAATLSGADQDSKIIVSTGSFDFADAVAMLTNGNDDRLRTRVEVGGGAVSSTSLESSRLDGIDMTIATDLAGATITRFVVSHTTVFVSNNGSTTSYTWRGYVAIMGTP